MGEGVGDDFLSWHGARGPGKHGTVLADILSLGPRPQAPGPPSGPRAPVLARGPRVPAPSPVPRSRGPGPRPRPRAPSPRSRAPLPGPQARALSSVEQTQRLAIGDRGPYSDAILAQALVLCYVGRRHRGQECFRRHLQILILVSLFELRLAGQSPRPHTDSAVKFRPSERNVVPLCKSEFVSTNIKKILRHTCFLGPCCSSWEMQTRDGSRRFPTVPSGSRRFLTVPNGS